MEDIYPVNMHLYLFATRHFYFLPPFLPSFFGDRKPFLWVDRKPFLGFKRYFGDWLKKSVAVWGGFMLIRHVLRLCINPQNFRFARHSL